MSHHTDHDHATGKCHHYLESISEYVDGTLDEDLCRQLEAHIGECDNCRVVVNTFAKTVSLYHQLPAPEMPSEVKQRLFKVLDLTPFLKETGKTD